MPAATSPAAVGVSLRASPARSHGQARPNVAPRGLQYRARLSKAVLPHSATVDVQFIRALRDRIRRGEITTTVRLWQRPHVKVGGRYALPPGEIIVTKVFEISLADVTPEVAQQSGFVGVVDLLKVAKHGPGRRVFLIEFRYVEARPPRGRPKRAAARR